MPDKAWKAFERRIAKSLGTERTPLSGGASRHTRSDTLHPDLYVECRQRKRVSLYKLFLLTTIYANGENKTPVIALHQKGARHSLAVVDWDFFLKLWYCFIDVAIEHGWPEGQHFIEQCQREIEEKGGTHD